jgi:hypothetical protein
LAASVAAERFASASCFLAIAAVSAAFFLSSTVALTSLDGLEDVSFDDPPKSEKFSKRLAVADRASLLSKKYLQCKYNVSTI